MKSPQLNLGSYRKITGSEGGPQLLLPASHLVTHGVVVGMTGSGKTGLVTVLAEEALRAKVPTIMIDVNGGFAKSSAHLPRLCG
jgi:type IV secretory pathway VirB4 component